MHIYTHAFILYYMIYDMLCHHLTRKEDEGRKVKEAKDDAGKWERKMREGR